MSNTYYVYIMTNYNNTTLYTGVTNNLERRVYEHKTKSEKKSFTFKYKCTKLVYYDLTDDVSSAVAEEKRIKGGSRKKKMALINDMNPQWKDLAEKWFDI